MSSSIKQPEVLPAELLENPQQIKFIVEEVFQSIQSRAEKVSPTTTPGNVKDIVGTTELIEQAVRDYERREKITEEGIVKIVWETPEEPFDTEAISIGIWGRDPGAFSQGRPYEGKIKNQRPVIREIVDDPDNPGYKRIVLGYFYDNTLRLTAWARTNKVATKRAIWIETMMEDYTWWFVRSGVNRILFQGWLPPVLLNVNNNPIYGRPMDYFVRTEKLLNVSQKTIEEVYVNLSLGNPVI